MTDLEKLSLELKTQSLASTTRRHFIKDCALGLGGIAMSSLLGACTSSRN
ncbi:MAG: twin-arginine translocation signal domain-containing protein, partial [Flavobacteriaceae bacterium]